MKGDYTRFTFDPDKHYTGVLLQQGRVQVDADWNEQVAIQRHLEETEAIDVIGPCGAPKTGGGFQVLPLDTRDDDVGISTGRIYVDGILCDIGGEAVSVTAIPTATLVQVASLELDGRPLADGDWVELSAPGVAPKLVRMQ